MPLWYTRFFCLLKPKCMESLKIALLQLDLIWEDAQKNRDKIDQLLGTVHTDSNLIILPEMFTTGFSMEPATLAETMQGETIAWLKSQAKKHDAAITGSVIIVDQGAYYNRLLWVLPQGDVFTYDKRHLFTLAGEEKVYTPGDKQLIVDYRGWKIKPLVCYDLRFPVWSRNTAPYDLLLYVANFPDKRGLAWRTLLQARAIENQVYTIGLNRVGLDGNGVYYAGDSCLVNYDGRVSVHLPPREMVQHFVINKANQTHFRKKLAFLSDQDQFTIHP